MAVKKKQSEKPRRKYLPFLAIFLFSFILYGNTLFHGYALDDSIVVTKNQYTQKGISGIGEIFSYDSFTGFFGVEKTLVAGGRYRPLSIATFAIEHSLFGGNSPFLSHLFNILLYMLTAILIWRMFNWFPVFREGRPWYLTIPFLTALLFLAHPVHTEVVANIKGRDEILCLLFSLLAMRSVLRWTGTRKPMHLVWSWIFFLCGLMSKENAMMFLFIIPLTIWFFTRTPAKTNLAATALLASAAILFIGIRYNVLGYINSPAIPKELLNNPFLEASPGQHFATILLTLGIYIKLLFFPWPLTHDYYPYHIPLVSFSDPWVIASLVLYLALAGWALWKMKQKDPVAWGILFYLVTLSIVSNIFFPVGTFMNERFIYMPSLGFLLAVAAVMTRLAGRLGRPERSRKILTGTMGGILVILTVLTVVRNRVWADDFTLFTSDVKTSVNSLKCNTAAGGSLVDRAITLPEGPEREAMLRDAIAYLNRAVEIYPENNNSLVLLGNATYFLHHDPKAALGCYLRVLEFDPYDPHAMSNALKMVSALNAPADAGFRAKTYLILYGYQPLSGPLNHAMGRFWGQRLGDLDSAGMFLSRATVQMPSDPAPFKDLGVVYGMKGEYVKAVEVLEKALQLDPNDTEIRQNLEMSRHALKK